MYTSRFSSETIKKSWMIMSSQDIMFVSFDKICVHVGSNSAYCPDGCFWCIDLEIGAMCVQAHTFGHIKFDVVLVPVPESTFTSSFCP